MYSFDSYKVFANAWQSFCLLKLFAAKFSLAILIVDMNGLRWCFKYCFLVLAKEIATLIESNPTNIDFDWNLVFKGSFILKMEAIEQNMTILDKVSGYLNTKNSIFSMFYRSDTLVDIDYNVYNWYGYQHNIIVVKLQCTISISQRLNLSLYGNHPVLSHLYIIQ